MHGLSRYISESTIHWHICPFTPFLSPLSSLLRPGLVLLAAPLFPAPEEQLPVILDQSMYVRRSSCHIRYFGDRMTVGSFGEVGQLLASSCVFM